MMRLASIAVLLAVAALLAGCPGGGTKWGSAADFNYTTFGGGQGKLSDHAGKVIVVNFWAVW